MEIGCFTKSTSIQKNTKHILTVSQKGLDLHGGFSAFVVFVAEGVKKSGLGMFTI